MQGSPSKHPVPRSTTSSFLFHQPCSYWYLGYLVSSFCSFSLSTLVLPIPSLKFPLFEILSVLLFCFCFLWLDVTEPGPDIVCHIDYFARSLKQPGWVEFPFYDEESKTPYHPKRKRKACLSNLRDYLQMCGKGVGKSSELVIEGRFYYPKAWRGWERTKY